MTSQDAVTAGVQLVGSRVSFVVILTVIFQTVALIIWGVKLDARVSYLEQHVVDTAADSRKLVLVEERQQRVIETIRDMNGLLRENQGKLDVLLRRGGGIPDTGPAR